MLNESSEQVSHAPSAKPLEGNTIRIIGPGLITGASDDDPSGIATYSQVGAQFGFGLGWIMVFIYPLMAATQEISARIGRVTGHGIAGNIRAHYPPLLLRAIVALLVFANVINIGADLGAMADALRLVIGGPAPVYVVVFALACAGLEIFSSYERYVSILKWLCVSLFAYVAVALTVGIPWGQVLSEMLVPRITLDHDYVTAVVAVLGTTISPYLFFWQSSEEAEEERTDPDAAPLLYEPTRADGELRRIRIDTYLGMGISNLIGLSMILTTAATLHAQGITNIESSTQAAEALRPIAGNFAFEVFALGIIGTGLLAVPVLAGSAAYALGEALGWRTGLGRRPREAKRFYGAVAVATLLGVGINFVDIDPIAALVWAAVINGVVAVPVMAVMMLMAGSRKVMGPLVAPRGLRTVGWIACAVMGVAVIAMFTSWL
jgi:NRAMP (natural resistance-associated macrophage protein)-like metal ion transporter